MTANIEQLRALSERLERATGEDMDLDGELFHIYPTLAGVRGYTSSVDDALELVDQLLPRRGYRQGRWWAQSAGRMRYWCELFDEKPGVVYRCDDAAAPSLPILRALVAALIAQAEAAQ